MTISGEVLQKFVDIVGAEDCKSHDFELAAYSQAMIFTAPTRPEVVMLTESADEISEIIKIANEELLTVVCRAGGTAGPISMADGGIVLDLSKMNKVLVIDEESKMVTVQAGCRYYDVVQELHKHGYDLPLKPWFGNGVSIGGYINGPSMVGSRVARYGTLNFWLFGLRVVLPTGEIVATGANAFENCKPTMADPWMSANSLGKIWLQSVGTFGVVTEATILMVPKPEVVQPVCFGFDSMEALAQAASKVQLANAATDIEHEDKDIYDLLGMPVDYAVVLSVTNEGYAEEVACKSAIAAKICEEGGGHRLPDAYADLTYKNTANFNFCTAKGGLFCCAAACASNESYPAIYKAVKDTWAKYGIRNGWSCWTCYPNWVQGWTIGYYDYDTQMEAYNMAMFEIQKLTMPIKDSYPFTFEEPFENFVQKIKDCLDPNGIMNPNSWFMLSGAQSRLLEAIELPGAE
ncbi:MAG: FAD-binding oxidoreductase [Coriobacteriia bacterium]|nr:FAD-binding oxidoreductase [Coriobacteriia bacterium]